MSTKDSPVDAYIAKSADFAQPILEHLRQAVHEGCPDAIETLKWGMPFFVHAGKNLAHMAAFKAHCGFGFWQRDAVATTDKSESAMGQFGRITTLKDLPPKAQLVRLVRHAVTLIDAGAPAVRKPKAAPKPPPTPPADMLAALRRNAAARKTFEALPPSHQREYIQWLEEAKRPETREKRLLQAIELMEEGKDRNWKYRS
jgi:uncharacterized protein YdeI (YjbR/CyaY-like superfamily)